MDTPGEAHSRFWRRKWPDHQHEIRHEDGQSPFGFIYSSIEDSELHRSLSKEPYRLFNVFKDTALGSNAFNFCLQVHPAGGTALTPSPAYHTPRISFYKQRLYLPASFDLFLGGSVVRGHRATAQDNSSPQGRIARIQYRGWEGLFALRVDVDIYQPNLATFQNEISSDSSVNNHTDNAKRSMTIVREGIGRTYRVELHGRFGSEVRNRASRILYWKGSKSALSLIEDRKHNNNGNLKLISPDSPGKVLAVWQNRTDTRLVGSLSVIDKFDEGVEGMLEDVVVGCLAVVLAERVSGRGWLGGLGKSRGR